MNIEMTLAERKARLMEIRAAQDRLAAEAAELEQPWKANQCVLIPAIVAEKQDTRNQTLVCLPDGEFVRVPTFNLIPDTRF